MAEQGKTTGQGFTLKVDSCKRWIAGCKIKNKGKGQKPDWSSKGFRVSGSKNENGPWEILVEDELDDNRGKIPASLLDFTFKKPVEIQFLKFDLVSYWDQGGGLQYFAAIPVTSKKQKVIKKKTCAQGGSVAETTTAVRTTIPATSKKHQCMACMIWSKRN